MEEEYKDFDKRNAWNSVYQNIRNTSTNFEYKDARKTENRNLNRYRDVNPFDHSRVRLQRGDKDYINASLVRVAAANRSYILTQGPLACTTGHFWLMVWEQESKAILMLNRVIEKNAVKCHQYWPVGSTRGGDDDYTLHDVGLMVTYVSEEEATNYTVRTFLLTDFQSGKSRTVLQFHYTTWPDFGVPESPAAFLNFLFAVRDAGVLSENVGPAVVHCSAGIGRSGTFCLVDSCLVLIEKNGSANSINICELLLEMRKYRMGLIQTPDQLRFSYMAIIEGTKSIKNKIDSKHVPSTEDAKEVDPVITNSDHQRNSCDGSDSRSESSDEGIANSNTCDSAVSTPPPLPPRPVRNHEVSSPSCNSISDSSVLADESLGSLTSPVHSIVNQNKIGTYEDVGQEDMNQKTDFNNSVSLTSEALKGQSSSVDQVSSAGLHKRRRKEREEKTAALVQKIKKKQKETELWQKRRSLLKRISFGLVILLGTGVLVYRYYSKG